MVDTGATISCIPEHGDIMKRSQAKIEKANLTVQLACGAQEHINKRIRAQIKPHRSEGKTEEVYLYVQNNAKDIFGYDALLGLKHLKIFNINIRFIKGDVMIFHESRLIGGESPALNQYKAVVRVVDNFKPNLTDTALNRILNKYKIVFTDLDVNPIKGRPMRFFTVHQRPIFAKQRHYTHEEVIAMKEHIKSLLDKKIIEPTDSGYAATSRIIPKKNGTSRLVVNYIPLNAATYRNSYALPHISDILGAIQGNQFFTTMDCQQGFYQIDVDQRDRHKTAFSTPVGNYQFRRCPFGARNSCAVFQSEMNRIFHDGLYTRCIIYVDDILVFGRTRLEHDTNLEWILKRCEEFNVKIKYEKCQFAKQQVQFLGFIISGSSIKPIPDRVKSLSKTNPPRDKTELKSIIGKLNFYSRFISNYSQQLEPLRTLLTKNKDYQWTQHHQNAFEKLISLLDPTDQHLLVPINLQKKIVLHILPNSCEAILTTIDNKIIMRVSRLLSTAESNYTSTEKQLLALTFAMKKFRLYLAVDKFTIVVPDKSLEKTLSLVNRPERVDNLLLRMPLGFDSFKFELDPSLKPSVTYERDVHVAEEIFYVDGSCKANGKPNCRASWAVVAEYDNDFESSGLVEKNPSNQSAELTAAIKACEIAKSKGYSAISIVTDSKYLYSAATEWIDKWKNNEWKDNKNKPVVNTDLFKQLLYAKEGLNIEWLHVKGHADNAGNIRADALAKSLLDKKPALLNCMSTSTSSIQEESSEIEELKKQIKQNQVANLRTIDGTVYYMDPKLPDNSRKRIYVPKTSRHWLITLAHDDAMYGGHLGVKKTYRKLTRFWWPKIHNDVESYVRSCDLCQRYKNPVGLPPGYLHSIPVSKVFEHIHIDIVGPLKATKRGHTYVITATDAFSKWAFARPTQNIRTSEVIKFVEEAILSVHGKPQRIITDRGTQFTSGEWKDFIEKLNIEHKLTAPYHPQANGIDERLNGTLMRILRAYVDEYQENWDDHLKWSLYVYNTTVNDSTGYSPYQVLHGMDSRSPLKPEETLTTINNETVLPNIRQSIRSDVEERIQKSQENQKKYYDRKHQNHNLKLGQLVYFRVYAPPTYLSKKFYVKWDGPCVIIGFVGDNENPRAVQILDYVNMIKKVVSIRDVKPYIDEYEKPKESISKNGGSHSLVNSSDSWQLAYDAFDNNTIYSTNTPANSNLTRDENCRSKDNTTTVEISNSSTSESTQQTDHTTNKQTHNELSQDQNTEELQHTDNDKESSNDPTSVQTSNEVTITNKDADLDITHQTVSGPITSSPKRVTISDNVQQHFYNVDLEPTSDSAKDSPVQQSSLSPEVSTREQHSDALSVTPIIDVDNPRKDPTYKPPPVLKKTIRSQIQTNPHISQPNESVTNINSRYNMRTRPSQQPSYVPTTSANRPTNSRHSTSSNTSNQSNSSNHGATRNRMQNNKEKAPKQKDTQAVLVDISEDLLSFDTHDKSDLIYFY